MSSQDTLWVLVIVGLIALALAGVAVWRNAQRKRALALQERFGPEYQHAVERYGSPARAERELAERERRVRKFNIRTLSEAERSGFARSWQRAQETFVDTPSVAVRLAHDLVQEVMRARGYPVEEFEQCVADLSVDHPDVVHHYREAHALHVSARQGSSDTERLRQAMVHYHALFDDLLRAEAGPEPSSRRFTPAHA